MTAEGCEYYMLSVIADICIVLTKLTSEMISIKGEVDVSLFYMNFDCYEANLLIVPL